MKKLSDPELQSAAAGALQAGSPLEWRSGFADANGIRLAWEEAGPPAGEPLLLIIGLGAQLIHWPDALCATLAQRGFRVIRFDNRDAGLSQDGYRGVRFDLRKDLLRSRLGYHPEANYTLHDMADDAIGLLDALDIRRAHLVGASMGGMIAQIAAARYPDRVLSLTPIMSSTNHPNLPPPRVDVIWHMFGRRPRQPDRETMVRRSVRFFQRVGSPAFPMPAAQMRVLAERAYDRAFRPEGLIRQTHAVVVTGSFEDLLTGIKAPTQVIHGRSDPLLRPACGRRIAKRVRGARIELIEGMGHDAPPQLAPRWAEAVSVNAGRA
jgi:pimeloyl-ACP methyl ester carboxylesterase